MLLLLLMVHVEIGRYLDNLRDERLVNKSVSRRMPDVSLRHYVITVKR